MDKVLRDSWARRFDNQLEIDRGQGDRHQNTPSMFNPVRCGVIRCVKRYDYNFSEF